MMIRLDLMIHITFKYTGLTEYGLLPYWEKSFGRYVCDVSVLTQLSRLSQLGSKV